MGINSDEIFAQEEEDTQHGQYLTFNIADEIYGIEIEYVTEIIGVQPITKIPEVAKYIKGVINLRGKVIPVIDVRLKFRRKEAEYDDRTCIIVVDTEEVNVGLIVDRVADVRTIDDENITPPPNGKKGVRDKFIHGIGKIEGDVTLLLDCKKLLEEEINRAIGDK